MTRRREGPTAKIRYRIQEEKNCCDEEEITTLQGQDSNNKQPIKQRPMAEDQYKQEDECQPATSQVTTTIINRNNWKEKHAKTALNPTQSTINNQQPRPITQSSTFRTANSMRDQKTLSTCAHKHKASQKKVATPPEQPNPDERNPNAANNKPAPRFSTSSDDTKQSNSIDVK